GRCKPSEVVLVAGLHGLAVNIELELFPSRVADSHGPRAPVTFEMVQRELFEIGAAIDSKHDRQRPGWPLGMLAQAVAYPVAERLRLLGEAQATQGMDRQRSVPDPGKTVIPVALPADLLGQPSRRRRDQCARGRVGH